MSLRRAISAVTIAIGLVLPSIAGAQSILIPGDIAIIGWDDNLSPDGISFVTLAPVATGTEIFFTDNGWNGVAYRGYPTLGLAGNEGVTKWTATSNVPVGTIVNAYQGMFGTWTTSGLIGTIPGAANSFTQFSLSQTGDQVAAFQSSNSADPLGSVTMNLFSLDDTGAYDAGATTSNTGAVPPGLTIGVDALTFSANFAGQNFMSFNPPLLLQTNGGIKADWITAIADPMNWTLAASGTQSSGQLNVIWMAPTIVADPSSTSACIGATAALSVTAEGGGLSYQWRLGTVPILGATSATLTISPVTPGDAGIYDCVVTNVLGMSTSMNATLTIDPLPVITTQPVSITVPSSTSATFAVAANGTSLTYQWRRNLVDLTGETSSSLLIASATIADQGNYDVVIGNACGIVVSNTVTLTVNSAPGPGQPGDATAAELDINGALNANGSPVGTIGDSNGPFFAVATTSSGMTFTIRGQPLQPIILVLGPLNPAAADFSGIGIGKIDVGASNPLPPFIPSNIAIVVDGTQLDFLSSLFRTTLSGEVVFPFPTNLPPGLIGGFQAFVFNSITLVRASNAVQLTVL